MNVKIGQLSYTVNTEPTERENDRCGSTYHQLSQISISPGLSEGEYRSTLLHEVLHACAHYVGIEGEEQLTEEQWISRISPTLLTVLCENEELCNALCLS